jgi:putative cardiolipin synthase
VDQLKNGRFPFDWTPVRLASDDPAKALGRASESQLMIAALEQLLGRPRERLDLVSGYFVPTDATVEELSEIARRGAQVRVLTNALEATDVPIVHAGYAGDRKRLLRDGVQLWEIRAAAAGQRPQREITGVGSTGGVPSGSGHALHAKTFVADGRRAYIGSFNLDPRSARLNTELGFVIDSPALTTRIQQRLDELLPTAGYELQLTPAGHIVWIERREGRLIRHRTEPGTTVVTRALVAVLSWLPIEWLL